MKRRFALPLAVALVVHSAILFGFRPPVRVPPVRPVPTMDVPRLIQVTEPQDPVDETGDVGSKEQHPAMPDLPPRPILDPADDQAITEPEVPIQDVQPAHATDRIDPDHFGPKGPGEGHGRSGPVMDPRRLDRAPHATSQPTPAYPIEARTRGLTGTVVVEFLVDRSGYVRDPVVVSSSDAVFEEPALRGVERWRFEPGRVNGRLVSFRMAVPVEFNLEGN